MNVTRLVLTSAILAIASGCAERRIPGTEIPDTVESREILQVMENYRAAVEARDAAGVVKLVSEKFHDEAGTNDPADDLDRAKLQQTLTERFAQLADVKLQIEPRAVQVQDGTGAVTYYYTLNYRLPKLTSVAQMESEIKQMVFAREGNTWKIVTGI